MITPDKAVQAVIGHLQSQKAALKITSLCELSEDAEESQLKPPYLGVFEDPDSGEEMEDGSLSSLMTGITVLCSSGEKKHLSESSAEAWTIAYGVARTVQGEYDIETSEGVVETLNLCLKTKPFNIYKKSAKQTIIQVHFYYISGVLE